MCCLDVRCFAILTFCLVSACSGAAADELRIPAWTAYMRPDPDAAEISEHGVTRWIDPDQSLNWYGKFRNTGKLSASVVLRLARGEESRLQLTINEHSHEAIIRGKGDEDVIADFGAFEIKDTGHQRISLSLRNAGGQPSGSIETLVLNGPATEDAHFNLKERRNAASVHLMYSIPDEFGVDAFYCEVTAVKDPVSSFYMACGWHRGYFGMQVNSPTERRIIFSVWDSSDEAVDRSKVIEANRVKLIGKGEGVYSGEFGSEGTGGH